MLRLLLGAGTPRWLVARGGIILWLIDPSAGLLVVLILLPDRPPGGDQADPTQ